MLEGATVTISLGSETLDSQVTNSSGEAIFNTGNFSSWSVGDIVTITASKTGVGRITSTLVLEDTQGDRVTLKLEQTSEFNIGLYEETNTYPLNFAMLVDFQGNKITQGNRLPVSAETTLNEPKLTNTYDSSKRLSTQTITIQGTQYRRTFTYTGSNFQFTTRSAWTKL